MKNRETADHTRLACVAALVSLLGSGLLGAEELGGSGISEPFRDATVSSTVLGTISGIEVKEGQFVEAGSPIVLLESALEELEVERRKLLSESRVELLAAERRVEMKQRDYESAKELFEDTKSVSQEEVFEKELDYLLAQAEVETLKVAEQREEIEYRIAQAQLDERTIKAPFDGVVITVFVEVGESCSVQQPLIRLADIRQVRLVVHTDPETAKKLRRGMRVTVRFDEFSNPFNKRGIVDFISPVVDPSSGLREVKILVDNADGRINPGSTGSLIAE